MSYCQSITNGYAIRKILQSGFRASFSQYTYVVDVNVIHEWRDLQFKDDSERQIFEKLSLAILFTLRAFARNLLRESHRRYICFIFRFDV